MAEAAADLARSQLFARDIDEGVAERKAGYPFSCEQRELDPFDGKLLRQCGKLLRQRGT